MFAFRQTSSSLSFDFNKLLFVKMPWELMKQLRSDIESKKSRLPTQQVLLKRIQASFSPRDRALMSLCYLTAGRINELLPKKLILRQHRNEQTDDIRKWEEDFNYQGLRKNDIEFVIKKNQEIMLVDMINEKNRTRKTKQLPIVVDKDRPFVDIVREYLDTLGDSDVLFGITRQRAWQITWKYLNMNPHFIRHVRLSHLILMYDYPDQKLIRFAGWSDNRPSKHYIEMDWEDLIY